MSNDSDSEAGVIATVRIDGVARGKTRQHMENDFMDQLTDAFDGELNTTRITNVTIENVVDLDDLRSDEPEPRDEHNR